MEGKSYKRVRCKVCGWGEHRAIHSIIEEGPRKGQPFDHAFVHPGSHPESICELCKRPNITWFAPSELWNLYAGDHDILCPVCFATLAETGGLICTAWVLSPENDAPAPLADECVARANALTRKLEDAIQGRDVWISVEERLPELRHIDDQPVGRIFPAMQTSDRVHVFLEDDQYMDRLVHVSGYQAPVWETYGDRVTYWRPKIAPPSPQPTRETGRKA